MSYISTITSSCTSRFPRITASKSAVVQYKGRQGTQLAGLDCAICESCWNSWHRQSGAPVPGEWVRTSCLRSPGTICDLSDPRLRSAWERMFTSRSLTPLITSFSSRKASLGSCTPTGNSYMYMLYPQYQSPHELPPSIPQNFGPNTAIHLCPSCYNVLDCTNLVNCFSRISTGAYASPPTCACDLGIPVSLALMASAHTNNISILAETYYAASYYSTLRRNKGSNCVDTGRWFNVTPNIQNFDACEGCANTLLFAVPQVRGLVRQMGSVNGQRSCDLEQNSHRFTEVFYSLLRTMSFNNAGEFTSYLGGICQSAPCPGPLTPYQGTIYRSEKLVVDACADCYFTQIAQSDVAGYFAPCRNIRFAQQPQLPAELNTLCCDVASDRVKQQLKNLLTSMEYSTSSYESQTALNSFCQNMTTRRDNLCTLLVQKRQAQQSRHSRIQQQVHTARLGLQMQGVGGVHALGAGWNGVAYGNDSMGWFANDSLAQGQAMLDASKRMGLQGGDYAEAARLDEETRRWV